MDRDRFDALAIMVAAGQTRRLVLTSVAGGSLAALLTAAGLGGGDAAAKSRCAKKCDKKKSSKKRRKCRKRCQRQQGQAIAQSGSATLTSQSEPDCATNPGTCVDAVEGMLTGTPIAEGTFEGELTGTNFQFAAESFTADLTGPLTTTETSSGAMLSVAIAVVHTQDIVGRAFTFEGTFEVTGGTGRFAGATGSGTVEGNGTREGQTGTVDAFALDGTLVLA